MIEKLHNDIKPLLANLNRLGFDDFFYSEDFNNLLLENGDDEIWHKFKDSSGFMYLEDKNKTFTNCLNYILLYWLKNDGNITAANEFNRFIKYIIIGYIDFNNDEKDFNKLLQSLDFGPITKETIDEIKISIDEKKYYKKKAITKNSLDQMEKYDYAIITALEDDEMENILRVANIEHEIQNKTYLLRIGFFNSNPNKKILFATQSLTGLVDSAILSTEIISKYQPKLLIMSGVLGGHPTKTNIGDVIIATKVFTIDKGKQKDESFDKELEVCTINNSFINKIKTDKQKISDYIRDSHPEKKIIEIHFEPIACVRQVIDKKGYFNENITSYDRKTIGVEMESYGVVRATELANEGNSDVLIIKSVMDNTVDKTDANKKFAGFTSATVIEYLFKENLV